MNILRAMLDVRPEERKTTWAAFGTLLAVTTGHTLLETSRDALFLAKLPASRLPWMYLVIVVLALVLARLGKGEGNKREVACALAFAAVVNAGFWVLSHGPSPTVLYALYIWSGLFASWVTLRFWTLLGRIHTMTQAKRLYGLIGSGAVLGAVLGALLARASVALFTARTGLLIGGVVFLLGTIPTMAVANPPPIDRHVEEDVQASEKSLTAGTNLLWQNGFAKQVLAIVLISTITVTLADFLFKSQIARTIPDTRALGEYLATFYAITNTLSLVAQLLIAPWIFRTAGVQRALFLFPAMILLAAGGLLASGGALVASVVLKGLDGVFRYSIHRTSTELLLVPVPDGARERIKPIVDLIGSRGGQALASVGIIALASLSLAKAHLLGAIIFALAAGWIALVVTIRKLYLDVFRETLQSGGLSGETELPDLDLGALETLFATLNSSRDVDVLAALDVLAEQHRERLVPALILYHPSRNVVLRALAIFARHGRTDFVPIADRLDGHPDGAVAAAALRARIAVAPDRETLVRRLDSRRPEVAVTALVMLAAREWLSVEDVTRRLTEHFEVADRDATWWATTAELARAIRDEAPRIVEERREALDEVLLRLARQATSAEAGGEREAGIALLEIIRAMQARASARFFPALVRMLARHDLRSEARAALLALPDAGKLLAEAMRDPTLSRAVRVHVPRALGSANPDEAAAALVPLLLTETDGAVRFKILRALLKLRRDRASTAIDRTAVTKALDTVIAHIGELRIWRAALATHGDDPPSTRSLDPLEAGHHLLLDLLRDKESHALQRMFILLELLYGGDDFEAIGRGLRSRNAKARASSLELLENLVKPPLRGRVLELVSDVLPRSTLDYAQALKQIYAEASSTMRTLAEYRAAELGVELGRGQPSQILDSLGSRIADRVRSGIGIDLEGATRAPA